MDIESSLTSAFRRSALLSGEIKRSVCPFGVAAFVTGGMAKKRRLRPQLLLARKLNLKNPKRRSPCEPTER